MKSKDPTSNSLSQDSTTSKKEVLKRLYVVTGKGGVGKTVFSLSLAHYLKNTLGKEVLYNSFDQGQSPSILDQLGIHEFKLTPEASLETYVSKKLGSKTISKWIVKTPFFSSLYQMIPGLGHMIMLGHIINKLRENPDLIIVLDSPSSGHALTMFESSHNFKEIFGGGLLFKDIEQMHKFLYGQDIIKTFVIGLPTQMAVSESVDVINFLDNLNLTDSHFIMNDSYFKTIEMIKHEGDLNLPPFLKQKIEIEKELFNKHVDIIHMIIPHIISSTSHETILLMSEKIRGVTL